MQVFNQRMKHFNKSALARPPLETTMAGLIGRILGRHLSLLGATAENPEYAVQHGLRVMLWTASMIRSSRGTQDRLNQSPLFICQFPSTGHHSQQRRLEQFQSRKS
jgi:hypothetical protein